MGDLTTTVSAIATALLSIFGVVAMFGAIRSDGATAQRWMIISLLAIVASRLG